MESSVKVISEYRLARAIEMLEAAEENLKINQLKTSLNRSYYAIFHAMRAVNSLDGYEAMAALTDKKVFPDFVCGEPFMFCNINDFSRVQRRMLLAKKGNCITGAKLEVS